MAPVTGSLPPGTLKSLGAFTLADLQAVRLVLRGDSVIDWHRLDFADLDEVDACLRANEFDPSEDADLARMERVKSEAIGYLRRQFHYPVPRPVEEATVRELLLLASTKGHRQACACTILKAMHVIHHLEGRELVFVLPFSDQEVFRLVEEKVFRIIGQMLAHGLPVVEFVGGRKHRDSLFTKLLSKQDTIAAAVYDKLRFRIVTRSQEDLLPVLEYLTKQLFPFNYVVPGQSTNNIVRFREVCEANPHLAPMLGHVQVGVFDDVANTDNRFSAQNYRVIHFVVDMPVRLTDELLAGSGRAAELGRVGFVICEFQLVDQATDQANELGDASHDAYKARQKKAVMRRLHLGDREDRVSGHRLGGPKRSG
jgi:uncharacterized protein (TIGR04552 family)